MENRYLNYAFFVNLFTDRCFDRFGKKIPQIRLERDYIIQKGLRNYANISDNYLVKMRGGQSLAPDIKDYYRDHVVFCDILKQYQEKLIPTISEENREIILKEIAELLNSQDLQLTDYEGAVFSAFSSLDFFAEFLSVVALFAFNGEITFEKFPVEQVKEIIQEKINKDNERENSGEKILQSNSRDSIVVDRTQVSLAEIINHYMAYYRANHKRFSRKASDTNYLTSSGPQNMAYYEWYKENVIKSIFDEFCDYYFRMPSVLPVFLGEDLEEYNSIEDEGKKSYFLTTRIVAARESLKQDDLVMRAARIFVDKFESDKQVMTGREILDYIVSHELRYSDE